MIMEKSWQLEIRVRTRLQMTEELDHKTLAHADGSISLLELSSSTGNQANPFGLETRSDHTGSLALEAACMRHDGGFGRNQLEKTIADCARVMPRIEDSAIPGLSK